MAELWKKILNDADEKLNDVLVLADAQISKATGCITLTFEATRHIEKRELRSVMSAFTEAMTPPKLEIIIKYSAFRDDVLKDITLAVDEIKDKLSKESPSAVPFIDWTKSEWAFSDSVISVPAFDAEGAKYLQNIRTEAQIAGYMSEIYGIEASVRFTVTGVANERIQRIEEMRKKELDTIASALDARATEVKKPVSTEAIFGSAIRIPVIKMRELKEDYNDVALIGEVSEYTCKDTKTGQSKIIKFSMTDFTGSVSCKLFARGKKSKDGNISVGEQAELLAKALKTGNWVKVSGNYRYDSFDHEMGLVVSSIMPAEKPVRRDTNPQKRVELHCHTQMSALDATTHIDELFKRAAEWGHKAIAITDHGVLQALPDGYTAAKKNKVKLIPGCEAYLIEDVPQIVTNAEGITLNDTPIVVLDVETTGLDTQRDKIIEIGAVKYLNGKEIGEYSQLIDPEMRLPERITEITGITEFMLHGMPTIERCALEFYDFIQGCALAAHNADFDMKFIKRMLALIDIRFDFPVIDTLALARNLYPDAKNHKLGTICKLLDISLVNAHRAVNDARATAIMLSKSIDAISRTRTLSMLGDINTAFATDAAGESHHIILLAKNQTGVTNLNRLVSIGHLDYFYRHPRIPRRFIEQYREGLIIGSSCESGELYRALVAGASDERLEKIASFYDYLEIQPTGNNMFLVDEGILRDEDEIRELNKKIVRLGDKLDKPVAATGDVHFLDETDSVYRAIIMDSKGYKDADRQPPLYFKTTNEMLEEFAYLGEETARRVVIETPNMIADMVEPTNFHVPHPQGLETFQPFWPEAEDELRTRVMDKAYRIYGVKLPELIQARIDKELNAIIGYGFSTLYMAAVKLVTKSVGDGYIVGSRGSVGSSLVAFLSDITEVNSLPAHYICPNCKRCEFDVPEEYSCGLDLPPRICPDCGTPMDKDGFNIPFEVFLGFKGDKVPDIDLNFSGEYQPRAHQYVRDLFGAENVYRAGTISTIADKTAYGYVLKYAENRGLEISNAEKARLARGVSGTKRTTGQHPAGMVIVPHGYEIYQFTAIQRPADDMTSDTVTTHFDFNSMHDILVKLDVLGHDDPTMLRRLQELTGIAPQEVPLHDYEVFKNILSLFSCPDALGITAQELKVSDTGTLGIPEFGTHFVRGMLMDTKPTTMDELVRISGLSHGTDVWLGNTHDLVKAGVPLEECFCTRDDIMIKLIAKGEKSDIAFKTMESVRKGKGLTPEMENALDSIDTPDWYKDSLKKIKYMFPKAHAVAYVTMALRIAYFKIYYPLEYYACYLMRNAEAFNAVTMAVERVEDLLVMIDEINALEKEERERKDDVMTVLEILVEMKVRGIELLPVDIYRSDATKFLIVDGKILPPINSLAGVGASVAEQFVEARKGDPFISVEDMISRKVQKTLIDRLKLAGCIDDLPETSQVTLFDF